MIVDGQALLPPAGALRLGDGLIDPQDLALRWRRKDQALRETGVLRGAGYAHRLGSSRIGPAALDLANLVTAGSAGVARYARTWRQLTGEPVPAATIGLGYEWAALPIPVEYLAWVAGNRPAPEVGTALDQIEAAIGRLSAENGI